MNNKEIEDIKPEEVTTGIQRLFEKHKKEGLVAGLIGAGLAAVIGTIFLLRLFKEKRKDLAAETDKVSAELEGIPLSLKNLSIVPLAEDMEGIVGGSEQREDFLDSLNRFSQKVSKTLGFPTGESFRDNIVIASAAIGAAVEHLLGSEKEE